MKSLSFSLVANGDSGLTILFEQPISKDLSQKIIAIADICKLRFTDQLEQIIPAYQSLTLHYQPAKISFNSLAKQLKSILQSPLSANSHYKSKQVIIPVCYDSQYAIDLSKVAAHCNLTEQQIIHKHSQAEYFVHMLGFSPGFLYLGGLDPLLTCPRKSSPDLSVPAGSVGIGAAQTGIYPQNSPGGWQIIGRTPISLFDIESPQPCIAHPLDTVIFKSIGVDEFIQISTKYP